MSRIAVIVIIFLLILFAGYIFVIKKLGDVRPAILPSSKPSTKNIKTQTGFNTNYFAQNLGGVRDLEFSPEGTLISSVTRMGKIIALPDENEDGKADSVKDILTNLDNPHGIAFYNGKLFVAEETRLVRYNWDGQNLKATLDKVFFDLPKAGNHFTRSILFDQNGKLYVSVGSTCNACIESNPWYAAIIVSDSDGNDPRIFASGLRNSVFMAINPNSKEIWATDMGRDLLGDDVPPDEVNIIREGKNYGWPNCYGDKVVDLNFNPKASSDQCNNTELPLYKIQAHSAPLGLTFINSPIFPVDWQGDLFLAYHGSWNRTTPTGYKIVHLKVSGDKILGEEDFITDFLQGSQTSGRPVDLIFDKSGNLYVSDDKSGAIYIVTKK